MKAYRTFATTPFLTAFLLSPASGIDLLVEDFSAGDGSFVEEATGATPIPAVYNAGTGTWSMDGDDSGPSTNTLTSPAIPVATTAGIQVTFEHRYSIEPEWDGTAIQISIDDGPFRTVPGTAFSQNSYTFSPLIGNHVLGGGEGFNGDSLDYNSGTFITSIADAGGVGGGSSIRVRFLGAWDEGARGGGVPNWEINSLKVETLPDADSDGMPDAYEDANSLNKNVNDSSDDADSDGSANLDEFLNGTDPQDDDSDNDGLLDGVESNIGTFVDANDTGTDPLNADTDGDGLQDGVEDNGGVFVSSAMTGTDPNKKDSDSDNFSDGLEVSLDSDPNDANSVPDVATVTIIDGLLGGDLTDPEDDGFEGETVFATADTPQTAGTGFNWVSITASEEEYFDGFGGGEGAFDIFDNQVGGGAAKWCCGGAPVTATVEFEEEVSLTHFTLTSGNDTPTRDPLDFQIQGSNDGINFEVIYDREDDISLWTERNQTLRIDLPSPSDSYKFIRYSVTRTGDANHQLNEIEYFGSVGAATPLEITSIDYNSTTNMITLTWNSRKNRTYSIYSSLDLVDFPNEIDDSVDSEGEITSASFPNPSPVMDKLFFRVQEND